MTAVRFFLKKLDQPLLPRHQSIDPRRLAVEELHDGLLFLRLRYRYVYVADQASIQVELRSKLAKSFVCLAARE